MKYENDHQDAMQFLVYFMAGITLLGLFLLATAGYLLFKLAILLFGV